MDIRITKDSEVPVRDQLAEQLALLIGTGKLRPGATLPSVRTLARELKIHHNTVSQVYQDLVDRTLLVRRRGTRMAVRSLEEETSTPRVKDLDDLINTTIRTAQDHGYTLQQLGQRVRDRLLAQPPDHILVVEKEPGLRQLLREELTEKLVLPIEACSPSDLSLNRRLEIGALIVCHKGAKRTIAPLVSKDTPFSPIWFSSADEHVRMVRQLRQPSIIAIVSVSELFLQTAKGLLAPAISRKHTLQEYFWPKEKDRNIRAADVVFCDSITRRHVKAARLIYYRLIPPEFLEHLASEMKSQVGTSDLARKPRHKTARKGT